MGLRQSIDEGAGEIGTQAVAELPDSTEELQAAIPEDTRALSANGGPSDAPGLSLERVVAGTPLDRFL